MKYKLIFSKRAQKQLYKLDRDTFNIITNWLNKNINGCEDPRAKGKALTANRSGEWRYRIGDYRVIAEIHDKEVVILVVDAGHRSKIYD